jgi:hypothetical protein
MTPHFKILVAVIFFFGAVYGLCFVLSVLGAVK